MIKLIIFDSDGVICNDFNREKYNLFIKGFLKKHEVSSKLIEKQNKIWKSIEYKALEGKISQRKANEIWIKKLGLSKKLAKDFVTGDFEFWKRYVESKSEIKKTLRKLRSMGYKLAVLSNDVRQSLSKKKILSFVNIDKYLDGIYTSHSIKHAKPEKEAYLYIVKRFRTKPSKTIFVGHEDYELRGAKRAGLKVVCFRKKSCSFADFHIKNFPKILQIV